MGHHVAGIEHQRLREIGIATVPVEVEHEAQHRAGGVGLAQQGIAGDRTFGGITRPFAACQHRRIGIGVIRGVGLGQRQPGQRGGVAGFQRDRLREFADCAMESFLRRAVEQLPPEQEILVGRGTGDVVSRRARLLRRQQPQLQCIDHRSGDLVLHGEDVGQ